MPVPDQLDELISRPVEGLNVEIKRWISPVEPEGIAKIVKGTFAIFNRNGGYFLFGFDDATSMPDLNNIPENVQAEFHIDKIQAIISRYASKPFEIKVEFRKRDGREHPIIVIPSGVTTVAASKRDLRLGSGTNDPYLLREGDVYFRTLGANGVVSSARARPEDWADILSICFDNREADIARFLRRHLAGDLDGLRSFLRDEALAARSASSSAVDLSTASQAPKAKPTPSPMTSEPPPVGSGIIPTQDITQAKSHLPERTRAILNEGNSRFDAALLKRTDIRPNAPELAYGRWNVALAIAPPSEETTPTKEFLGKLEAANPSLTGWPTWLVSSRFSDERNRPYVTEGGWQALIVSLGGWSGHLEFQRFVPRGEFFLGRVLQDDLGDENKTGGPGKVLDPILMILRVAEAMMVGLAFARALGWPSEGTTLGFRFEWTGLAGRSLKAWANPMIFMLPGLHTSRDATVESFVEVPLDKAPAAIAPYIQRAVAGLFASFDGAAVPATVIEDWTRRLVDRKL